jgi:hypothetical protein
MAREASKKWLKAIDELRSITKTPNGAPSRQKLVSVFSLLHQMDTAPALPRTTWETLITSTQVIFGLCVPADMAQRLEIRAAHAYPHKSSAAKCHVRVMCHPCTLSMPLSL